MSDHTLPAISVIRAWVGETIFKRGQDYQMRGRVQDLAATPAGGLVAWVQGSKRYATCVSLDRDQLVAHCTCPYVGTCKHAVAVVLAYINRPEQAPPLPVIAAHDTRIRLLDQQTATVEFPSVRPVAVATPPSPLYAFLSTLSQQELVALLIDLSRRFPDVQDALAVRQMLASDDVDQLESEVFGRIMLASKAPGQYNRWDDEGDLPDYDSVRDGLQLLLDRGQADAVVRLGEELLATGIRQVEQNHDDGETAATLVACLDLVFEAIPASSLAPHEQLRWTFAALLKDPYDLCYGADAVLEHPYPAEVWNMVADELLAQLNTPPITKDEYTRNYQHNRLSHYAILALEEAGRDAEIIPLCEREARENGSYIRLVERLLAAGRRAEAEQWARTGIVATERKYPGIANQLREVIVTLHTQTNDWAMVAAMRAGDFFERPMTQTFQALMAAAAQAAVQPAVHAAALHYLETGQRPQRTAQRVGTAVIPAWPLPDAGILRSEQRYALPFPQIGLLIELAANAKQPDEVLRWYDQRDQHRFFPINHDMVADAVVQTYPERAAQIWQQLAEMHIAQTNPAAYQQAAVFLRKLRQVRLRQGQEDGWQEYLVTLRDTNRRKRRLVEILNALLQEMVP